jgi:hypothetical protein
VQHSSVWMPTRLLCAIVITFVLDMCLLRQTAIATNAPLLIPMVGTPRTHYSSPVYGDMHGFPPAILTTGTRDLLLSSTVRVHRKLRQAGVEATHAQFLFDPSAPETKEAFEEIAQFLTRIWANNGHVRSGTPLLGPSSGRRTPSYFQKAISSFRAKATISTHMGICGSRCSDQDYIVNFLSLLDIQGLSPFA